MPIDHHVQPTVGLGPLRLGMSMDDVRALIGEPPEVSRSTKEEDGYVDLSWVYEDLDLELTFDEDFDSRLHSIETEHEHATLEGVAFIGMPVDEFLDASFGALGKPTLDDELGDELVCYMWDEANMQVYAQFGSVISLVVMPLYDESGEQPQWPAGNAS